MTATPRRWGSPLAALLLAAGLAVGGGSATAAASPARPRLRACERNLPQPLRCGHIVVPMRRGDPSLGTTKVAFAIRPHTDRRLPSLGTVVAVEGGPGGASTAEPYVRSLTAVLGPLLRRRDLLLFDERGTGRSDAIDCPGLQKGLIQEPVAIAECANQLGPRFAGYTTGEGAADLNAVRRALGLGKIILYGDSYGTLFGQGYAVRFPGSLRGLILESAYPGTDPYYRTILPAALHGLRVTCRVSPRCSGNPVARLTRVVRRFRAAGRSTDGLLGALLEAGNPAPREYLLLDNAERRYLAGEPRPLNRLLATWPAGSGDVREFSLGQEVAVECNDYPKLWNPTLGIDERVRQLSHSVLGLPRDHFAPFSRREYILSAAAGLTECLYWPAPPAGGLERPVPSGWQAPTSFPTLITAGQVDDVTTLAEARQVKRRFPRSRLFVVPDRGHVSALYYPFDSPAVGVIRKFVAAH